MSDSALRKDVIDELEFEPSVDATNIGVAVHNGVVTLTGHVGSYAEKNAAEKAAQRVKGVRAIAEEIEVRVAGHAMTNDDEIAARALSIIAWDARIPGDSVKVKVQRGWVTLTGTLPWHFQRAAAESAVRRLSGVAGVINDIAVKSPIRPKPQDVRDRIMSALRRNAELEGGAIRVLVDDDKVTLEGKVSAWSERGVAERAAWSVPGVSRVEDRLSLG